MKKENENEKVQSKVEKTVEHKDKKDVTPEEKLNNIIKKIFFCAICNINFLHIFQ